MVQFDAAISKTQESWPRTYALCVRRCLLRYVHTCHRLLFFPNSHASLGGRVWSGHRIWCADGVPLWFLWCPGHALIVFQSPVVSVSQSCSDAVPLFMLCPVLTVAIGASSWTNHPIVISS